MQSGNVLGKVIIVGDLFPVPSNFNRFSAGDIIDLFGDEICRIFNDSDYRICNLEGALSDNPGICIKTGPVIHAPQSTVNAFKKLGIDCCALANNHITDAGDQGVLDTIATLERVGIQQIGAGSDSTSIRHELIFSVSGHRIGLYNVAETMYNEPARAKPGAFLYDEYVVCKELEILKKKCDYLIILYHGGTEKFRYPSPQTKQRFHRMVDSGANMILSQHTHCVGAEEYYHGAYLLYGQGNFLFRSFNNEFTDSGLIIELVLEQDKITVNRYLVRAVNDMVRLDEDQDFSLFEERSSRVYDDDFLSRQFRNYALHELTQYLGAYKGRFFGYRVVRKLMPRLYKQILLRGYSEHQMLFMLHSLRSEQNREVAIEGLKAYLGL